MVKKCPACGSTRYKEGYCRKCGYVNDSNYLRRKNVNLCKKKKTNGE